MSEQLNHHGVQGMKWGVRRTPQQLGHAVAKKVPSGEKKAPKVVGTKTPGKAFRKSTSISDEELQKRINRLNMEERYDDLVSRQNARNNKGFKATAKKLLANSAEDLGRQLLSTAVSKLVNKLTNKETREDINTDIDDPSKASLEQLRKATERLNAIDNYRKAKNPKKENDDPRTEYDLDADPKTLGDSKLQKVIQRIENENKFYTTLNNKNKGDMEGGRGPVQEALARMAERDANIASSSRSTGSGSRLRNDGTVSSTYTPRASRAQIDDWLRTRNKATRDLKRWR